MKLIYVFFFGHNPLKNGINFAFWKSVCMSSTNHSEIFIVETLFMMERKSFLRLTLDIVIHGIISFSIGEIRRKIWDGKPLSKIVAHNGRLI